MLCTKFCLASKILMKYGLVTRFCSFEKAQRSILVQREACYPCWFLSRANHCPSVLHDSSDRMYIYRVFV